MNEKIPTKLLKLKTLAEVPRAEYLSGPDPKDMLDTKKRHSFLSLLRKSKSAETPKPAASVSKKPVKLALNAAAWLRVPESQQQVVSLVICYKDTSGEFAVVVDEAEISSGFSLMLSGCVTFESQGTPEYIKACVAGLKQNQLAYVDELHVQKIEMEAVSTIPRKTA